jgi:hypothetical protein
MVVGLRVGVCLLAALAVPVVAQTDGAAGLAIPATTLAINSAVAAGCGL